MHTYVVAFRGDIHSTGFSSHFQACKNVLETFCNLFKEDHELLYSSIDQEDWSEEEIPDNIDNVHFPEGWKVEVIEAEANITASTEKTFWSFHDFSIQRVTLDEGMTSYFVWSDEHTGWWKPNEAGYTKDITKAGIFTREKAMSIVENSMAGRSRKFVFEEMLVPCDEMIQIIENIGDVGVDDSNEEAVSN